MATLEVCWTLSRPMRAPDRLLHLDALLAWGAVDRARAAGAAHPDEARHHLPLERHESPRGWCWRASALVLEPAGPEWLDLETRPIDYAQAALDQGSIYERGPGRYNRQSGRYKGGLWWRRRVQARAVRAWCEGDPEEVTALLARITHLGPGRRNNWGRVRRVSVRPLGSARGYWRHRAMPDPAPGYAPVMGTLRPDYWDRRAYQVVYEPMEDAPWQSSFR